MPVVKSKVARRVAACAAVAFVSVAFTAACGGSDDSSSTSGTTGQNGGNNAAFTAYSDCLAKNGVTVTMPSGNPGGNGGTRPSGAAGGGMRASGQPRPSGSFGGGGGFPGGGGGGIQKPAGVDDATWQKAETACASVKPSFGAGRGNGGGGNGANAAYTDCLKKNGVTDTANLNTADAATAKAIETCKVLKPAASATS